MFFINLSKRALSGAYNTNYKLAIHIRFWPIGWGSGYFEGHATLRLKYDNGESTDIYLGWHQTKSSEVAEMTKQDLISISNGMVVNAEIILHGMKASDVNHNMINQQYNITVDLKAEEIN